MLGGCAAPPRLPPLPPAVLPPPEEWPFGDETGNLGTQAWIRVFDALKPRHPRLGLKIHLRPGGTRMETLRTYYDRHLFPEGWREVANLPTLPGRTSWASGYEKGKYVFAVAGLGEGHGRGDVLPLDILTDVPEPPTP